MADILDSVTGLLDGQVGQVSQRIGADEAKTRTAIHAAVPALMAAFAGEAQRGGGIRTAIRQDHDGAIIDQLPQYLSGTAQLSPRTTNGAGILDHTLGDQQEQVARAVSARSGLDLGTVMKLLPLLAPIVMGMLGKKSNASPDGGFSLDDLGSILGRETEDAKQSNPDLGDILGRLGSGGGIGDVLGGLLGGRRDR
jgi:hypothetical protein